MTGSLRPGLHRPQGEQPEGHSGGHSPENVPASQIDLRFLRFPWPGPTDAYAFFRTVRGTAQAGDAFGLVERGTRTASVRATSRTSPALLALRHSLETPKTGTSGQPEKSTQRTQAVAEEFPPKNIQKDQYEKDGSNQYGLNRKAGSWSKASQEPAKGRNEGGGPRPAQPGEWVEPPQEVGACQPCPRQEKQ